MRVPRPCCAAGQATPPTAINAVTTIAYMLKKNAASPQLAGVIPLLGGAGFTADQVDSLLGIALGVNGGAIPNSNYVAGLQVGDRLVLDAASAACTPHACLHACRHARACMHARACHACQQPQGY